jgi:ABC-type transport system substrate-binding protein
MALEAGTVDFVYAVPPGDIPRLEKNPDLYLIPGKPTRSMYLVLNTQWGPLKDKRVRQALNYALDKETITERLFKGRADVMDCPIPSHSFGYAKVGPYPYDPTKAKQLLKEAGYPDGFEVTLRYGKGRYIMSDEIAEATQSYFAAVGVKTKIEALDWAALSAKNVAPVEKNDNQMVYLGAGNVQLDFDQTMTDFIKAAWPPVGMTPSFYDNPKFDELHQKGASTTDSEKRKAYYKEAFQIMWDDAPNVFLWFEPAIYAARKTVHEAYVRHDETIWLKEAWIDGKASSAAYSLLKLIAVAKKDLN